VERAAGFCEPLDRCHGAADCYRKGQAAEHARAVDENGAGPALAMVTALYRTGEVSKVVRPSTLKCRVRPLTVRSNETVRESTSCLGISVDLSV
jgi:hypothetical protein